MAKRHSWKNLGSYPRAGDDNQLLDKCVECGCHRWRRRNVDRHWTEYVMPDGSIHERAPRCPGRPHG